MRAVSADRAGLFSPGALAPEVTQGLPSQMVDETSQWVEPEDSLSVLSDQALISSIHFISRSKTKEVSSGCSKVQIFKSITCI